LSWPVDVVNLLLNVLTVVKHVARQAFTTKDCIPQLVGTHTIVSPRLMLSYAHNDAWMTDSDRGKMNLIAELLSIKHHYCSLELFNADKVDAAIEFLCTM